MYVKQFTYVALLLDSLDVDVECGDVCFTGRQYVEIVLENYFIKPLN